MSIFTMQAKLGLCFLFWGLLCIPAVKGEETPLNAPIFQDEITGMNEFPVLRAKSGHTIVLSGIERPQSHGIKNPDLQPIMKWVANQLIGQDVIIHPSGNHFDMLGRLHAFVKKPDQPSINMTLLKNGLTRVQLTTGFTHQSDQLFAAEAYARRHKIGLWGEGKFKRYDANDYQGPRKGYIIATGKITQNAKRKTYLYINFGEDWRDDFTVGIPVNDNRFDIRMIEKSFIKDKIVEIRGLIENWNGPFIRLDVAEHLRLIEE